MHVSCLDFKTFNMNLNNNCRNEDQNLPVEKNLKIASNLFCDNSLNVEGLQIAFFLLSN